MLSPDIFLHKLSINLLFYNEAISLICIIPNIRVDKKSIFEKVLLYFFKKIPKFANLYNIAILKDLKLP